MKPTTRALMFFGLAAISSYWIIQAGDLEPPGPPAPTMKDLATVEPRVAIRNDFDGLVPIVIAEAGSYYLAENIFGFPASYGIQITASQVTLDLNGFTVYGNLEVGSLDGIRVDASFGHVTIKNGTVRDFLQDGIHVQGESTRVLNVEVTNNFGNGIMLNFGGQVLDSQATHNSGIGIQVASAVISRCTARENGGRGISASRSSISDSSSHFNGEDGIFVNAGSTVRGCSTTDNTGDGIDAEASLVQGNASQFNTGLNYNLGIGVVGVDNAG